MPHNGKWSDSEAIGNSDFTIADDVNITWIKNGKHSCSGAELKQWMNDNYGVSRVKYDHNEPDFYIFADKKIGSVYVENMSTERSGGEGTFAFAEQKAAKHMNISVNEVKKYMQENELTWHECADGHTILAVPTRINAAFKHSGGISIERSLESVAETVKQEYGNITLSKESASGMVLGLEKAVNNQRKSYKDTKKNLFSKQK